MWLVLMAFTATAAEPDRWLERRKSPKVEAFWTERSETARQWIGEEAIDEVQTWLKAWGDAQQPPPTLSDRRGGTALWRVSRPITDAADDYRISAWQTDLYVQREDQAAPGTLLPESADHSRSVCQASLDPTGTVAFVGRRQAYSPEICGKRRKTGCKKDLECEVDRVTLDGFETRRVGSFKRSRFSGGPDGQRALLVERVGRRAHLKMLDPSGATQTLMKSRRWITVRWLEEDVVVGWSTSTAKGKRRAFRVWLGPPDELEPFGKWPRWGPLWSGSVVGVHRDEVLARTDDVTEGAEVVRLADDAFDARTVVAHRTGMMMGPSRVHDDHLYTTFVRDGVATMDRMSIDGTTRKTLDLGPATQLYTLRAWDDQMTIYRRTPVERQMYDVVDGAITPHEVVVEHPGLVYQSSLANSVDGTEVAVSWLRRDDLEQDGEAPVWIYAYGGFSNSVGPPYVSASRALWLEAGGIVAVVHARGGRERGEPWHEDAILENLDRTYEDVEAAANFFVDQGWSARGRILLSGGSNGGLTAAATMVRDPGLFGALIPSSGVFDLVRGPKFGRWWPKEYGKRRKEEDLAFRTRLSPVHASPPTVPAMLVLTGERDPVVDPSHSYKLVNAWEEIEGGPTLLHVTPYGSHGAKPTGGRIHDRGSSREASALELAFALKAMGMAVPVPIHD